MKKKEKAQLRESEIRELSVQLVKLREEYGKLVVTKKTKAVKNVRQMKLMRQKMARIQTFMREKELTKHEK